MILSILIVRRLDWTVENGIWICLLGAFVAGIGSGFFGLLSGILSTLAAGVFCAIVIGFFILLNDIRNKPRNATESGAANRMSDN